MRSAQKKLIFKNLFIILILIDISNQYQHKEKEIQSLFTQFLHIPNSLLTFHINSQPCQIAKSQYLAHLCLDDNGEFHILQWKKHHFTKAFNVFWSPYL